MPNMKEFKPCAGCPTPGKCKKAGMCMMKESRAPMPKRGSRAAKSKASKNGY
jgi:hypothetical protein